MKKSTKVFIVGLILCVLLCAALIGVLGGFSRPEAQPDQPVRILGATGGGKEDFLADAEVAQILAESYGIVVEHVSWSNSRLTDDSALAADTEHAYDFMFCSDQRYYEQYQTAQNTQYRKRDGYIALNTPIVFYSWAPVVEVLADAGIVTEREGVHYVSDVDALLRLTNEQVSWQSLCDDPDNPVSKNKNPVSIISVDPVTSSPGATFYGWLAAVMDPENKTGHITDDTLAKLQRFYTYAGFLAYTPSDLFQQYLRIGMGTYPLIVDYEKSLIGWAISNPAGYESIRDRIVMLYPEPTIWNSHCIISFTENGDKYVEALRNDARIQQIAFERYGFRMGLTTAYENTAAFQTQDGEVTLSGIPGEIYAVVAPLQTDGYTRIVEALKETLKE